MDVPGFLAEKPIDLPDLRRVPCDIYREGKVLVGSGNPQDVNGISTVVTGKIAITSKIKT